MTKPLESQGWFLAQLCGEGLGTWREAWRLREKGHSFLQSELSTLTLLGSPQDAGRTVVTKTDKVPAVPKLTFQSEETDNSNPGKHQAARKDLHSGDGE